MNPNDPNVFLLERAAEQLGEALLEQLVFVGGAVAGVLITDPAMPEIRPTQDLAGTGWRSGWVTAGGGGAGSLLDLDQQQSSAERRSRSGQGAQATLATNRR